MFILETLEVPITLFCVIIAPLWLILHYRSLNKKTAGLSEAEHEQLQKLTQVAHKMADRIEALESILDNDTPEWRKRNGTE